MGITFLWRLEIRKSKMSLLENNNAQKAENGKSAEDLLDSELFPELLRLN